MKLSNLDRNIHKYYWAKFFRTLSFWLPIMTLYPMSKGLSLMEMSSLVLVQMFAQTLFEIPSGVIADFFGRKRTLMLAGGIKLAYLLIIILCYGYWPFFIGWFLCGVSDAFESGADSAFVFDTLNQLNRKHEYGKVEGRGFSLTLLGWGIGSILGGLIIPYSYELAILLHIFAVSISVIISFTYIEPNYLKKNDICIVAYISHMKTSTRFVWNNVHIKWLSLLFGTMFGVIVISHIFYQPYMKQAGLGIEYFGVFYFLALFVSFLASNYAHNIKLILGLNISIMLIPILLGVSLIANGLFINLFGIIFLFINQLVFGFMRPIILEAINNCVDSSKRATVLSFAGFLQGLIALSAPFFGFLADTYTPAFSLLILGIVVCLLGCVILYKQFGKNVFIRSSELIT
ncbi:MFS transporter [bacterium]|nr:MFS transporter [bacterium]MBU1916910.1 MFS transporter [bacterium]